MGGDIKRILGQIKKEHLDKIREQKEAEREPSSPANSRVYRPLPLSPLMDPAKIAARQRYREAKTAEGVEPLTSFQHKLATNPYGM